MKYKNNVELNILEHVLIGLNNFGGLKPFLGCAFGCLNDLQKTSLALERPSLTVFRSIKTSIVSIGNKWGY